MLVINIDCMLETVQCQVIIIVKLQSIINDKVYL